MKPFLFLLLAIITISGYGQVLSKTSIIYESKDAIVMNNGTKYNIIKETPLYAVLDTTIPLRYSYKDKVLILNRVLLVREKEEQRQLIEWTKGKMTFYEFRTFKDSN